MSTYKLGDGSVVVTDNATAHYQEKYDFNGHNEIGRSSRSQWHDQTLYRSRKGRYYLVHATRISGENDWAEWVSPQEAARFLTLNEIELRNMRYSTRHKIYGRTQLAQCLSSSLDEAKKALHFLEQAQYEDLVTSLVSINTSLSQAATGMDLYKVERKRIRAGLERMQKQAEELLEQARAIPITQVEKTEARRKRGKN